MRLFWQPLTPDLSLLKFLCTNEINSVAARPLMLSPCLATSPTDTSSDVTRRQHPVTSPLHSPTSLSGVAMIGDSRHGFLSPVNSSSGSSARPSPTSPTENRQGVFQLDTSVRGSAQSLVGQVPNIRTLLLCRLRSCLH